MQKRPAVPELGASADLTGAVTIKEGRRPPRQAGREDAWGPVDGPVAPGSEEPHRLVLRATALCESGLIRDALLLSRRAAALAPASQPASGLLVRCLWALGKEEEAIQELERYIGLQG